MAALPINPNQSAVGGPVQPIGGSAQGGAIPTNSATPQSILPQPSNTAATNPFAAPGAIPITPGATAPTGAAGLPGTVQTNGINWNDGSNTVTGDFKDTYGAGTGTAISDVLSGLGTTTDSAIQATIANTDLAAGKQYANIQSNEAASGVTANSSTAALAAGDFYTGVNSQLQQTIGGEELNEENTLLSTLTGEGSAHGPDESTFDSILNGVTDAGEIGTALAGL